MPNDAMIILLGHRACLWTLHVFGKNPDKILLPFTWEEINYVSPIFASWQPAFANYTGETDIHYPSRKLLKLFQVSEFPFPINTSHSLLPGAEILFTDGTNKGKVASVLPQLKKNSKIPPTPGRCLLQLVHSIQNYMPLVQAL